MAEARISRTLDATPDALWRCVRAFGDLRWLRGEGKVEIRGEGIGQVRVVTRPWGTIHERLTSLDDATRTLTYTVDEGMPFPVTDYEATVVVSDDAGRGRLTWFCRFEPDEGVAEREVAEDIEKRYGGAMRAIEAYLKQA
jgi:hypothetical protein